MMLGRFSAIDYFKFFAMFSVTCGHVTPFIDMYRNVYFLIDTFPKMAVTYFFIVSGFLFGRKILRSKSPNQYFLKYFKKIAALYFFWTLFYFAYYWATSFYRSDITNTVFSDLVTGSAGRIAVKILYFGYAGIHLWFLIALLWSVAIVFVAVKFNRLKQVLIGSLCLNILGLFGGSYSGIADLAIPTRNAIFYGLFYCTLGCYFAFNERIIKQKLDKVKPENVWIAVIIFMIIQMTERAILIKYFRGDMFDDYFISSIPLAISLFFVVMMKPNMGESSYLTRIGEKTLGIYVVHYFMIDIISCLLVSLLKLDPGTIIYQILIAPLVFITSYFAYEVLHLFMVKSYSTLEYLRKEYLYQSSRL